MSESEPRHAETIEGDPPPEDVFEPHRMGVELFDDMDAYFASARRISGGEEPKFEQVPAGKVEMGKTGIAIVTPGRLIMFDPCPLPGSVPEDRVDAIRQIMPADPKLTISAIANTRIDALVEDIDRAIPFRGLLNGSAYLGHNVIVFEGHPSAFESGVRGSDALVVDSAMKPFLPKDWIDVARRVMNQGGRIIVCDRETSNFVQILNREATPDQAIERLGKEGLYVAFLLTFLMRGDRSSVEVTSRSEVPDLAELTKKPEDLEWLSKQGFEWAKLNADVVINILLRDAGWSWRTPFKRTGVLQSPVLTPDGSYVKKGWNFTVTLRKDASGRKQVEVQR